MKLYYQGNPGSYMHIASLEAIQDLSVSIEEIVWLAVFQDVWEAIDRDAIGLLAIENSYMGSIHPNLYNFLKFPYKIIGEVDLPIQHCLCSHEQSIEGIHTVYSQQPALDQCYQYIQDHNFATISYTDTALAAKYIAEAKPEGTAAIASEKAAELYGLHVLDHNIQDNTYNTTRFVLIAHPDSIIEYSHKVGKISLLFEVNHLPASLYKCLGVFATNLINLTKIESLPSYKENFSYLFRVTFEGRLNETRVQSALQELEFYTNNIRILGDY